MYQLTKQKVLDVVTSIGRIIGVNELDYENDIPYWQGHKAQSFEGIYSVYMLSNIFGLITNVYSPNIFSPYTFTCTDSDTTKFTYIDHKKVTKYVFFEILHVNNHWKEITSGYRKMVSINGFQMYKVIENQMYRTFLWYLIDPLAFITNVRDICDTPGDTIDFFDTIESNIKKSEAHNSWVYWVLKCSYVSELLVADVIDNILDAYITSIVLKIEENIKCAKKALGV